MSLDHCFCTSERMSNSMTADTHGNTAGMNKFLRPESKAGQRPGTGLGFSLGAVLATFAIGSCAFSGLSGFWKQSNYKQATKHELLGGYYLLLVAFWCKRTELRPAELLTQELLGW